MTITSEDIKLADKFYSVINSGYYVQSSQVTDLYNRVTGKNVTNTNCGTCIRKRVLEIHGIIEKYKKELSNGNEGKEESNK